MLFLFSALLATALANPVLLQNEAVPVPQIDASYLYAVDFSQAATVSQFNCLRQSNYGVGFFRGYNPSGSGSFDNNVVTNVNNAYSANVGSEVYMTPQVKSSKNATQQVDELYKGLKNKGISVRSLWIQVTSPTNWYSATSTNVNFINAALKRFRYYGITPGVYTSNYDWSQITNSWTGAGSDVMLWYWNVYGSGVSGESYPDFTDFRSFGGFYQATVKQFGQVEQVCNVSPLNRDVFINSNFKKMAAVQTDNVEGPVVGGYIH